jgi:hypothetical protein
MDVEGLLADVGELDLKSCVIGLSKGVVQSIEGCTKIGSRDLFALFFRGARALSRGARATAFCLLCRAVDVASLQTYFANKYYRM